MRKLYFLGLLTTLLSIKMSAQITWSVRGGMGVSYLMTDAKVTPKPTLTARAFVGMELPLSLDISFMPSVGYAMKGGNYDLKAYSGTEKLQLHYLQVPLQFGYRLTMGANNLVFKAGPYLAFALSGTLEQDVSYGGKSFSQDIDIFATDGLEKAASHFDAGGIIGVDYEMQRFFIGVDAEMGFISLAPNEMNLKNLAAYLSIGYKF